MDFEEHVKEELVELKNDVGAIADTIVDVRIQLGMLKVKSGIWGLMGGAIPVALMLGVWFVKNIL